MITSTMQRCTHTRARTCKQDGEIKGKINGCQHRTEHRGGGEYDQGRAQPGDCQIMYTCSTSNYYKIMIYTCDFGYLHRLPGRLPVR